MVLKARKHLHGQALVQSNSLDRVLHTDHHRALLLLMVGVSELAILALHSHQIPMSNGSRFGDQRRPSPVNHVPVQI